MTRYEREVLRAVRSCVQEASGKLSAFPETCSDRSAGMYNFVRRSVDMLLYTLAFFLGD